MAIKTKIDFLKPEGKLVDEVVDWLCGVGGKRDGGAWTGRVRSTPEGAISLEHVMVVVPTAQSGRNLRFALARKAADMGWGGIIPPRIVMPNTLLMPSDVMTATEAEELAAMATVLAGCEIEKLTALFPKPPIERGIDWALDMAGVLLGIEMILGEAAL